MGGISVRRLAAALVLTLVLSRPALAAASEETEEEALRSRSREAVAVCVEEGMTDVEVLTVLHDWLALHCDYGAAPRSETAYGSLIEGTGNCVGYAAGYARLAAEAGLQGAYTYSGSLDHAWTLVTLDGTRYFTDCTWDDGKNQKLGLIRHKYFLFDQKNAGNVGHSGWDTPESVPGGPLEAVPWKTAVTRVIFRGSYAYYIDESFSLICCDRSTWETEVLFTCDERWPDFDPADRWTPELYTGLICAGDRLFFNTPEAICCYRLDSSTVRTFLTPDTSTGVIYGIGVQEGELVYSLAADEDAILYDVVGTGITLRHAWGY